MNIYGGNLSDSLGEAELRDAFPEILPMLVLRGLAIMSGRPESPAFTADV